MHVLYVTNPTKILLNYSSNDLRPFKHISHQIVDWDVIFMVKSLLKYIFCRQAETAANKLLSQGCQNVLITLGSQGAVFLSGQKKEMVHIPTPKVTCVDSTGAGDAFIGALAYLLANMKELSMEKCIEISCIVAADSVTRPGTQISFPGPEVLRNVDSSKN